jgi:hypothetical protein
MYEVMKRHTYQELAELIGVTKYTIVNWHKDPVYQAALQEKMKELIDGLADDFKKDYFFIASGISAELITRINEGGLGAVQTDRLMKMFHTAIHDLRELEGSDIKAKEEVKDPFIELRRRIKTSSSGKKYLEKKEIDKVDEES